MWLINSGIACFLSLSMLLIIVWVRYWYEDRLDEKGVEVEHSRGKLLLWKLATYPLGFMYFVACALYIFKEVFTNM